MLRKILLTFPGIQWGEQDPSKFFKCFWTNLEKEVKESQRNKRKNISGWITHNTECSRCHNDTEKTNCLALAIGSSNKVTLEFICVNSICTFKILVHVKCLPQGVHRCLTFICCLISDGTFSCGDWYINYISKVYHKLHEHIKWRLFSWSLSLCLAQSHSIISQSQHSTQRHHHYRPHLLQEVKVLIEMVARYVHI